MIDVLDVNDNAPVFDDDFRSITIDEDAPVGTEIIHLRATDADLTSVNSRVSYHILEGDEGHHFHLNSETGKSMHI